ncbi:UNKNOWN [Stylonychia lemnae]|uniref:Sugar phosphate transporter domain-containing protein n=1 Tax=Stylonychia lemnae TaxID=5949 RepID=A0A078AK18_STYLE|nr:UNKNOWN [Stylonychia lemnae]|eukprot:CDW82730.1 UNKNOWN [Stylonychia lemnae]
MQNSKQPASTVPSEKKEYSMFIKLFACFLYAASSSSLTFLNKSIYSKFGFQSPINLLFTQCLCNVIICFSMMMYKQFNPEAFKLLEKFGMKIPPFNECMTKVSIGVRMGIFNLTTVMFGLFAVKLVSIPLFLTFRRCTIITTAFMGFLINGQVPDRNLSLCLLFTGIGALWENLNSQLLGYFLVFMNNFSQSGYNVYVSKVNSQKKVLPFEINFYFALCGLPLSFAYMLQSGDITMFTDTMSKLDQVAQNYFILYVFLSSIMGIVITVSVLMTVTVVSPIATNVTGNLKDVLLTYVGFIFFDDQSLTQMMLIGLTLSFMGSMIYVADSYNKQNQAKAKSN